MPAHGSPVPARMLPSRAASGRSSRSSRPMHHTSHVTDPQPQPHTDSPQPPHTCHYIFDNSTIWNVIHATYEASSEHWHILFTTSSYAAAFDRSSGAQVGQYVSILHCTANYTTRIAATPRASMAPQHNTYRRHNTRALVASRATYVARRMCRRILITWTGTTYGPSGFTQQHRCREEGVLDERAESQFSMCRQGAREEKIDYTVCPTEVNGTKVR
mmetsp:Transcript_10003/g.30713  ORF Transcript_10003/g.30713 Transcript_10003/m.30713 type:complete len:216 (-) Transcript_10003:3548-4195(-)